MNDKGINIYIYTVSHNTPDSSVPTHTHYDVVIGYLSVKVSHSGVSHIAYAFGSAFHSSRFHNVGHVWSLKVKGTKRILRQVII